MSVRQMKQVQDGASFAKRWYCPTNLAVGGVPQDVCNCNGSVLCKRTVKDCLSGFPLDFIFLKAW